eukprot:Polyplicarium_translucidae@DN3298_c0_g1_i3.p1
MIASRKVQECKSYYGDPECSEMGCEQVVEFGISRSDCYGPPGSLQPPLYVYYELTGFPQNHKLYVNSRSDRQLAGEPITDADLLRSCGPLVRDTSGNILSPCGLVASTVFNDTIQLNQDGRIIPIDDSPEKIAWDIDVRRNFKNPPATEGVNQWINEEIFPNQVENGHFIVWMRTATMSRFRKLYGVINEEIQVPFAAVVTS